MSFSYKNNYTEQLMNILDPTIRFSQRADRYSLYRPEYPEAIVTFLEQAIGLKKDFNIADIGSGTGIFSGLLLGAGYSVNAVEPNDEMRAAAEDTLSTYQGFRSIDGTAEQTTLADHSIDLITVAQAFHWFRPEETRKEFERILKPSGHVLLIWNILQSDTPFLKAYTELKEEYSEKIVHPHRADLERIKDLFHPSPVITHNFRKTQQLDARGLKGHLLSFSTVPLAGDDRYQEMTEKLDGLFEQYEDQGLINMEYETKLYLIPSTRV